MESMEDFPIVDPDDVQQVKEKGGPGPRRLRIFDEKMRNLCWQKADVVSGRHPERWRKDVAGNVVCRRLTRCEGCLCHEYDHIQPYSKGGETDVKNCQILQSRVNRLKSNKDPGQAGLKQFSCDLKFTGLFLFDGRAPMSALALGENSAHLLYVTFIFESSFLSSSNKTFMAMQKDKELDLIEMAVYGNVERPGMQCRCKSVAETLGTSLSKAKGSQVSCELPYQDKS